MAIAVKSYAKAGFNVFSSYPTQRQNYPYFELFWSVFSRIRTEYGKIRTRITPNTDTFHALQFCLIFLPFGMHFATHCL